MAKKTTKKAPAVKAAKKEKVGKYRILIYNSINQVQRNKFMAGTEDEVGKTAEALRKTVSKGSRIEIIPV